MPQRPICGRHFLNGSSPSQIILASGRLAVTNQYGSDPALRKALYLQLLVEKHSSLTFQVQVLKESEHHLVRSREEILTFILIGLGQATCIPWDNPYNPDHMKCQLFWSNLIHSVTRPDDKVGNNESSNDSWGHFLQKYGCCWEPNSGPLKD